MKFSQFNFFTVYIFAEQQKATQCSAASLIKATLC